MQKAAVGEETFSCLGSGTAVQHGRAVLQLSKAREIRAGSCNCSMDLSREGSAQAALPAGWSPFLSSLPFLLPRVPSCPMKWWVALGRLVRMSPCQSCQAKPPHMSPCWLQTSATPPAFPGLCVSVSGSRLQLERSALLMLGMPSRTCHHSPCHWWSLWMCCLLHSLQAGCWAGREGKGSFLPPGEKPLLEIWARSSPADHSGRSPTGMGWARLWQGIGRKD